jgi:hypothetical protein
MFYENSKGIIYVEKLAKAEIGKSTMDWVLWF